MINLTKSIHYIFRVNLNDPVDVRIFQNQFWNWGVYISSNFDWSVLVVDRALDFSHHWRVQFGVKIKQLEVCTIPSSNDGFETLSTISKPWNEKKLLCGSLFGSISCEEAIGMFENINKTKYWKCKSLPHFQIRPIPILNFKSRKSYQFRKRFWGTWK